MEEGTWPEYQRLVFFQLSSLTDTTKEMDRKIDEIQKNITIMQTKERMKAGVWGGASGLIIGIILAIISHMLSVNAQTAFVIDQISKIKIELLQELRK